MELIKKFSMDLDTDIPVTISPQVKKELTLMKSVSKRYIQDAHLTDKQTRFLEKLVKNTMLDLIEASSKRKLTNKQERKLTDLITALNAQYFRQGYSITVATIITYIYILVLFGVMFYFWYESSVACDIGGFKGTITYLAESFTLTERICLKNAEHFRKLSNATLIAIPSTAPIVYNVVKHVSTNMGGDPTELLKLIKHPEKLIPMFGKEKTPSPMLKKSPPRTQPQQSQPQQSQPQPVPRPHKHPSARPHQSQPPQYYPPQEEFH